MSYIKVMLNTAGIGFVLMIGFALASGIKDFIVVAVCFVVILCMANGDNEHPRWDGEI